MKQILGCLCVVPALLAGQPATADTVKVGMKNSQFSPAALTVQVGDRVVWINDDEDGDHRVNFDDPSLPGSDNMKPRKEHAVVFDKAGEFSYNCRYHKDYGMRGKVVVKAAAK